MKATIKLEDVFKLDIQVCEVVEAKRMEGKDKLLVLQVQTKTEVIQVITNIGLQFQPEQLIGLKMPFILNLEPVTIAKHQSFGMIVPFSQKLEEGGELLQLITTDLDIGATMF